MKFWKIFRYEFAYQWRNVSTWLYASVLLGLAIVMRVLVSPGDGIYPNNTFYITSLTVIGGFIWLIMCASIAGEAAARDIQSRMHPLTYTSPVTKFDYLAGRFLAAFTINGLLLLALPLGIILTFYYPGADITAYQSFRSSVYLSVYFFIALPTAFVATAFQFVFSALSRNVVSAYAATLMLALFPQIIAVTLAQLVGNWQLVTLLDPVGVAGIIGSELQTWTVTDKNTRLVTLEGMFLLNRIFWIMIAAGALWITYLRFKYANITTTGRGWFKRKPTLDAERGEDTFLSRPAAIIVPPIRRTFGLQVYVRQTLTIARISFGRMARNPMGLTLVAVIALVSAIFGYKIMTQFGMPLTPTTPLVIDYFTAPVGDINSSWVVIPLLIMYFAGQLVWSEREAGLSDIADAVPVPEWALLTGKFLGLLLMIVAWMALLMAGGIAMQLGLGYTKIDILLYVRILFGLQLIDYALFALLALVVHVVVNQKKISYLVMLLAFIFIAFHSSFKVEHRMLVFGADPGWLYTDMLGFGSTIWPWICFKLYWVSWGVLLAVAARLLWTRGREQALRYRLRQATHRFTKRTVWTFLIGTALLLVVGIFTFYNTNVANEYETASDINHRKAEYERRYARYRNVAQPQLTAATFHVEIYPDQKEVDIQALYTLVNNDTLAIDSIHIGGMSRSVPRQMEFNRPVVTAVNDNEVNHHIYVLKKPLQPGDSLQFSFVVHHQQKGFQNSGNNGLVIENGTYFTNYDLLPSIGYKAMREINDPVTRNKYNLAARPSLASLEDVSRTRPFSTDQIRFEAIVGTTKDEVAVAPGTLHREWTEGDRNYFHYKTDASIGSEYAFSSASYAIHESTWKDVAIRIYYHPGHATNVDRMVRSVQASLDYFSQHFGPYPYKHLTILERSGTGTGASADASMINYGEQYALMNPKDVLDLPYYILSHEVAHQWWGLARLTPANVQGTGVLIESLAVYSGMLVLEKNYGEGHLKQYVDFLHSFYERPRSLATASLLQADETFLYYRKGGIAMYTLSKYIGKDKVNEALHRLLEKRTSGALTVPTSLDLYHELRQATPDSLSYLLQDFFEKNTYWRLKTRQFTVEELGANNWQVTLTVHAQKVVVDSTGVEKDVPMNDWLEVGIFEADSVQPLHLQMHRIRSGEQLIRVRVPRKPIRAGIDPNNLMIDLRTDDNMIIREEE